MRWFQLKIISKLLAKPLKEKEPEATLLLSGYAKSGTNPSEWFDANAPGFKSINNYSTPDFRYEVNRNHKGEREDFAWIECTEGDFRVYSCGGRRSRDEYKGLRGTGILAIRVEGVIIPFGLVKPQSLEQLDLDVPPEFKALEQLMKEYHKLLERRTEIQKTIAEIEAKMFGKFRSREKRVELEGLQNQIEQKKSDISKVQDALTKAEEKRSLNSYETTVTSYLLKAAKKPDSTIRGEIPLECGSFSALDWFKKIQELAKDES